MVKLEDQETNLRSDVVGVLPFTQILMSIDIVALGPEILKQNKGVHICRDSATGSPPG